jgi:hypothetical protein
MADLDQLLQEELTVLQQQEETMKRKLDEYRRFVKNSAKQTWQENLNLICLTSLEEKKSWAISIEKDSLELGKITKVAKPSAIFLEGPKVKDSSTVGSVNLAKLIVQASIRAKVQLSKPILQDLEKSGLGMKYFELTESASLKDDSI